MRYVFAISLFALAACGGGGGGSSSDPSANQLNISPNDPGDDESLRGATLSWSKPSLHEDGSSLIGLRGYYIYAWWNGESAASLVRRVEQPNLESFELRFPYGGSWEIGITSFTSSQQSALSNMVSISN